MVVIEVTIYDLPFITLLGRILGVININNLLLYPYLFNIGKDDVIHLL